MFSAKEPNQILNSRGLGLVNVFEVSDVASLSGLEMQGRPNKISYVLKLHSRKIRRLLFSRAARHTGMRVVKLVNITYENSSAQLTRRPFGQYVQIQGSEVC